jgi:uncharacterized membrane protein
MSSGRVYRAIFFVLIALYPFVVYAGIQHLPIGLFGTLLALLLLLRAGVMRPAERRAILPVLIVYVAYAAITALSGSQQLLLWYPAVINFSLCLLFALSLRANESILLRLVRARNMKMSVYAPAYLHRLTAVWAVFFLLNGSMAILTGAISLKTWALYNGFIAYLLTGALMGGELLFRSWYKRSKGV